MGPNARQVKAIFDRVKGGERISLPSRTFMPESANASATVQSDSNPNLSELETQLMTGPEKVQLKAAADLWNAGDAGYSILQTFLLQRKANNNPVTFVDGRCYEMLLQAETTDAQTFLQQHFPNGVVPLRSEAGIDYQPLQRLLAVQNFLEADRTTLLKMCELAGPAAVKRKWIYFTDIESFPVADLQTINTLWLAHSEGKFGFSVQRQLWLSVGKDWEALWPKIKWKSGKTWTRYPGEFIWDLSAPRGHLPLSNQLRGVQTITVLLSHPAWTL
jgi:GUN4-like/ARM-like repeat domain, GUN4-N terminal